MPYSFATYEFLVYVIPGGLLLFSFMAMFPGFKGLFGQEPVNVGGLVLFLVVAFAIGQLLQSAANYAVQWPMSELGWAYRTNAVLFTDQDVISTDDRDLLINAVNRDFRFPKDDLQFKDPASAKTKTDVGKLTKAWRSVIDQIYGKIHPNNLSDRLGSYSQHYSLNKSLTLAYLLMFIVLSIVFALPRYRSNKILSTSITPVPRWLQPLLLLVLLIAVAISIERTSAFDKLFVDDLFWTYIHSDYASQQ
jgi:hypothetical protein